MRYPCVPFLLHLRKRTLPADDARESVGACECVFGLTVAAQSLAGAVVDLRSGCSATTDRERMREGYSGTCMHLHACSFSH